MSARELINRALRRRFSDKERQVLFEVAGGQCEICGKELGEDWHADHVVAFSKGGPTDVVNGQALCRECNLKKGDTDLVAIDQSQPTVSTYLRQWQIGALDAFNRKSLKDKNFMCVATPGSGKTTFALQAAASLLENRVIDNIVVVVPTQRIRDQWSQSAPKLPMMRQSPLQLDSRYTNKLARRRKVHSEFDGYVMTYQQLAQDPLAHRKIASKSSTLFIFDEIHHVGDQDASGSSLPFGEAAQEAAEFATYRIGLSGTLWRSDDHAIPYVTYEDGVVVPDYEYSYLEALNDGVCRPVLFRYGTGDVEWKDEGVPIESSIDDEDLPEAQQRDRLRMALWSTKWVTDVLRQAHEQLLECRQRREVPHPNAKALAVALNQEHAQFLEGCLYRATGESATVVTHDVEDASKRIDQFPSSDKRWLIAVDMVSEGIDIPDLRVGCYLTNVTRELKFRQTVGRFVRAQGLASDNREEEAHIVVPKDPRIVAMAENVLNEVRHFRDEREKQTSCGGRDDVPPEDYQKREKTLIRADYRPGGGWWNGQSFDPDVISKYEDLRKECGLSDDPIKLAEFALKLTGNEADTGGSSDGEPSVDGRPLSEIKAELRQEIDDEAGKLAKEIAKRETDGNFDGKTIGKYKHQVIWDTSRAFDWKKPEDMERDELERRLEWVRQWRRNL